MYVDWTETGNLSGKIVVCIVLAYKIQESPEFRILFGFVCTCIINQFAGTVIKYDVGIVAAHCFKFIDGVVPVWAVFLKWRGFTDKDYIAFFKFVVVAAAD